MSARSGRSDRKRKLNFALSSELLLEFSVQSGIGSLLEQRLLIDETKDTLLGLDQLAGGECVRDGRKKTLPKKFVGPPPQKENGPDGEIVEEWNLGPSDALLHVLLLL